MIGVNRAAFDLRRARSPLFTVGALTLILAACGGGNSAAPDLLRQPVTSPSSSQPPTPPPSQPPTTPPSQPPASPPPSPTPIPSPVSTTFLVRSSAVSEQLPPFGSFTELVNFPAASAAPGTNLTVTLTTVLPSGVPSLPSHRQPGYILYRVAELYVVFEASAPLTYQGLPGFQLANVRADLLALHDPTQTNAAWRLNVESSSWSGVTETFYGTTAPFTFASKTTYVFAVYREWRRYPCSPWC